MDRWGYWLNEPIFIDQGISQIAKRKHVIHSFCYEGLIPFVESFGYKFRFHDKELFQNFLWLLFRLFDGHTLKTLPVSIPCGEEQYETYCYYLDTQAWETFWSKWGHIQDFEKDQYAHRLQFELHGFVWSWLDFDRSRTVQELYQELEEDEYQEETKGKDDPYLQETSKRDYQDRHW